MITTVNITGQTMGNRKLLQAMDTREAYVEDAGFNNYRVVFKTMKEAKKQLWEAFKYLRKQEPEYKGISYSRIGGIRYDASKAEIAR